MTDRNEENFKLALKSLVNDEPQKLAFFDGLDAEAGVPPFVPEIKTADPSAPSA